MNHSELFTFPLNEMSLSVLVSVRVRAGVRWAKSTMRLGDEEREREFWKRNQESRCIKILDENLIILNNRLSD